MRQVDPERARRMPLQEPKVAVGQDVSGVLVEEGERAAIRGPSEQPANVGPARAIARRVRVFGFVGVDMVQPMGGHPACGSVFQAAEGDRRQRPLKPQRHLEAAVGEQAVVTEVDAHAEHMGADQRDDHPRPTEAPRQQGEQCQHMHRHDREQILPMDRDPTDIPAGQAPENPSRGVGRGNRFCLEAARCWNRYRGGGLHGQPECDVEGTIG